MTVRKMCVISFFFEQQWPHCLEQPYNPQFIDTIFGPYHWQSSIIDAIFGSQFKTSMIFQIIMGGFGCYKKLREVFLDFWIFEVQTFGKMLGQTSKKLGVYFLGYTGSTLHHKMKTKPWNSNVL